MIYLLIKQLHAGFDWRCGPESDFGSPEPLVATLGKFFGFGEQNFFRRDQRPGAIQRKHPCLRNTNRMRARPASPIQQLRGRNSHWRHRRRVDRKPGRKRKRSDCRSRSRSGHRGHGRPLHRRKRHKTSAAPELLPDPQWFQSRRAAPRHRVLSDL